MFSKEIVKSLLKDMSTLLFNSVLSGTVGTSVDSLTKGQSLLVWFANLLKIASPLTDEQITFTVSQYKDRILKYGDDIDLSIKQIPCCTFVILDRNYVALSGDSKFVSLHDGSQVDSLPKIPLETISYNMTTLFVLKSAEYDKGKENADKQSRTGSTK